MTTKIQITQKINLLNKNGQFSKIICESYEALRIIVINYSNITI